MERPLDDKGVAQAEALVPLFRGEAIGVVLSSRATRCQQTVAPVAADHGLTVVVDENLTEGTRAARTRSLLQALADGTQHGHGSSAAVLCSHGDVIPETLGLLLDEGIELNGARGCEKGSVWELVAIDGVFKTARYLGNP